MRRRLGWWKNLWQQINESVIAQHIRNVMIGQHKHDFSALLRLCWGYIWTAIQALVTPVLFTQWHLFDDGNPLMLWLAQVPGQISQMWPQMIQSLWHLQRNSLLSSLNNQLWLIWHKWSPPPCLYLPSDNQKNEPLFKQFNQKVPY